MKTKPLLALLLMLTILTGCASVKILQPTGGSRSDGIIEMSYEYGMFEKPQVRWGQGQTTASDRCRAWGYNRAEIFGGATSQCKAYNSYGNCLRYFVTVKYQCIGSPR